MAGLRITSPKTEFVNQRETVCFIGRMPLELLERVFELVRGKDYDSSCLERLGQLAQDDEITRSLSWAFVSHVCRYWRECALKMKHLWRVISIGYHSHKALHTLATAATTFLERSSPLPITFHDSLMCSPFARSYDNQANLMETFYAKLAENCNRISSIFLPTGMIHKAAWTLLQRDLPNTVEIVLESQPYGFFTYGDPSRQVRRLEPLLEGRSSSLKKLTLHNFACALNSYPHLTHLHIRNSRSGHHLDDWILPLISGISSTLQVLQLYGTGCLRPLSDRICLPHLQYAEAMPSDTDKYQRGADHAMAILHSFSLSASVSILWRMEAWRQDLQFPHHEHCGHVRNIVVSLEHLGGTLLEGDTVFSPLKTAPVILHGLCCGFPNVISISLPSSWLVRTHPRDDFTPFARFLIELDCNHVGHLLYGQQLDPDGKFFCASLSDIHIYLGSVSYYVRAQIWRAISAESIEGGHSPTMDCSANTSIKFHRGIPSRRSCTIHFHPGEIPTHQISEY